MKNLSIFAIAALFAGVLPVVAQTPTVIDCDDAANAEEEVCLGLPLDGATNLGPLAGVAAGVIGLGALAGGGSTTSTTSTSTTGTTGGS